MEKGNESPSLLIQLYWNNPISSSCKPSSHMTSKLPKIGQCKMDWCLSIVLHSNVSCTTTYRYVSSTKGLFCHLASLFSPSRIIIHLHIKCVFLFKKLCPNNFFSEGFHKVMCEQGFRKLYEIHVIFCTINPCLKRVIPDHRKITRSLFPWEFDHERYFDIYVYWQVLHYNWYYY